MKEINKLPCGSPMTYWCCWTAILMWMIACIMNVGVGFCRQNFLDMYGAFILIFGIGYILRVAPFSLKRIILSTVSPDKANKVMRMIWSRKTYIILCSCVMLFVIGVLAMKGVFKEKQDYIWLIILCSLFFSALSAFIFQSLLKIFIVLCTYLKFTMFKHSGRMRRVCIDVVLMFCVLFFMTVADTPEWVMNTLVMSVLALFLYDTYNIIDVEKERTGLLYNLKKLYRAQSFFIVMFVIYYILCSMGKR